MFQQKLFSNLLQLHRYARMRSCWSSCDGGPRERTVSRSLAAFWAPPFEMFEPICSINARSSHVRGIGESLPLGRRASGSSGLYALHSALPKGDLTFFIFLIYSLTIFFVASPVERTL